MNRPSPIADQLVRIAGRLGQLAAQLGLSPTSEKALRRDAALEASHARWIEIADAETVVETAPSAPASTPSE